jgi:hypothetical protein
LDLFDSSSSASDGEAAVLMPPRKRPQKSLVLKSVMRLSEASAAKGTLEWFLTLCLSESYYIELFLAFVIVKTVVASATAGAKDSWSGGVRTDDMCEDISLQLVF